MFPLSDTLISELFPNLYDGKNTGNITSTIDNIRNLSLPFANKTNEYLQNNVIIDVLCKISKHAFTNSAIKELNSYLSWLQIIDDERIKDLNSIGLFLALRAIIENFEFNGHRGSRNDRGELIVSSCL